MLFNCLRNYDGCRDNGIFGEGLELAVVSGILGGELIDPDEHVGLVGEAITGALKFLDFAVDAFNRTVGVWRFSGVDDPWEILAQGGDGGIHDRACWLIFGDQPLEDTRMTTHQGFMDGKISLIGSLEIS